jgi:hypothetical protein
MIVILIYHSDKNIYQNFFAALKKASYRLRALLQSYIL